MRVFRAGWTASVAVLLCLATSAAAVPPGQQAVGSTQGAAGSAARPSSGEAYAGLVRGTFDGVPAELGPLARCSTGGPAGATSAEVEVPDVASYGEATTSCYRDPETGIVENSVQGNEFALQAYGDFFDDAVSLDSYSARCTAVRNGFAARIRLNGYRLGGLSVDELPNPIPLNYEVQVLGDDDLGPQARIVFNEQVRNGRGGFTVSVLHLDDVLTPGGTATQDIYLGRVDCTGPRDGTGQQ